MDSIAKLSSDNMKSTIINFITKAKKGDEFEIGFKQNEYKITLEKYITLLKYLVSLAKSDNLQIIKEDTLNVSYNYDYENFNNYRIAIKGIDNINNKLGSIAHRENHVIFSMLLSQFIDGDKSIEVLEKIKNKKNMVDIDNYNLRIRLSTERDIPKKEYQELLKLSEKERKYINFRYIQRVSLIIEDTDDYTIRIDLSQVKGGNKPLLIDFGRTFYLHKIPDEIKKKYDVLINKKLINKTYYDYDLNIINDIVNDFNNQLSNLTSDDFHKKYGHIINLQKYITDIIRFIAFIDYSTNNTYYQRNTPQMIDLLNFLHDKSVDNIYDVIYNPINTDKLNNIINCIFKMRILHKPSFNSDITGNNSIFSFYNDNNNMFARTQPKKSRKKPQNGE